MIFEIVTGAILLGTFIYHRWIEDHTTVRETVNVPRVDEGAPVPLVYGRCRVRAPILAWGGGQRRMPIGRDDTEVAHANDAPAYFLDMLYVVGIPFYLGTGQLITVYVGDIPVTAQPGSAYDGKQGSVVPSDQGQMLTTLPIWGTETTGRHSYWGVNPLGLEYRQPDIFSDDYWEPSAYFGLIDFFDGNPNQVITDGFNDVDYSRPSGCLTDTQGVLEVAPMNDYFYYFKDDLSGYVTPDPLPENIVPSDIPSYRGFMMCCLYRWCNGPSTSQPTYGFEVQAQSAMFTPVLGVDADPAAVIYDLLTSPWGKLALPTDKVDSVSFTAASVTLRAEENGYSRVFEEVQDGSTMIGEVLKQIDGVMYEEPTTGKLVLKLVRSDYSVPELDDINPDNATPGGSGWYQVQGWSETINQVRFTFKDRQDGYGDTLIVAQNAANFAAQGNKLRSIDIAFPGCCVRELAQRLASRELAVVSRPMVRATMVVDRSFYLKRPGDVVTLTWPELGIVGMVMRIARVDLGQLHDGKITLDMIRDVFDVFLGAYP